MLYPERIRGCFISLPHRVIGCYGIIRESVRKSFHPIAAGSIPAVKCIAVPCNTIKIRDFRPCPGTEVICGQSGKVGRTGQRTPSVSICHKQISLHSPAGCHAAITGKLDSRTVLGIKFKLNRIPKINRIRRISRGSHGKYHGCRQHPCQL